MARRRRSPTAQFVKVSRGQLAGVGLVGLIGLLGGLNAALDLGEKLARLARGKPPSGRPL